MIVAQGSLHMPMVLGTEQSSPSEPLVLKGEVRNYPVKVGEVAHVWATESSVTRGVIASSVDFRVVRVESVRSDGVVVSVCRHPCIGDVCPCMQVVVEPDEVLVPVSWILWCPLAWCVIFFLSLLVFVYSSFLVLHRIGRLSWYEFFVVCDGRLFPESVLFLVHVLISFLIALCEGIGLLKAMCWFR